VHHRSTAAAIDYDLPNGSVADELCYWRDMTFGPHFWNILGKSGFAAALRFGESCAPISDRKAIAVELHRNVVSLREIVTPS
ncbi:MAG: hypothetical protein ACRDHN_07165, partial [Thermomicrobiales bacterium]